MSSSVFSTMRFELGVLLSCKPARTAVFTAESVYHTMSFRSLSVLALGAAVAVAASACSGAPSAQPPLARGDAATFAQRQAAAHAQGRWLTEELSSVKLTPVPASERSTRTIVPVCDTDCGTTPRPPAGYTLVTRTTSSYKPYWSNDELTSDTSYVKTATFSGNPGYDLRSDYSDGTSSIMAPIANSSDHWAVIHPNGTSTVIAMDMTSDGGATASVVASSVPTTTLAFAQSGSLSPGQCAFITAANGIIVGAIAEVAFPEFGPWSYRIGAGIGAVLTVSVAHAVGAC
jgi:hypothetical protein